MDELGIAAAIVVGAAACYRLHVRAPRFFTSGLILISATMLAGAFIDPLDTALAERTGLDNLAQLASYCALVLASFAFAHVWGKIGGLGLAAAASLTLVSIAGMLALYLATDLKSEQVPVLDALASPSGVAFDYFLALGLLPTHIMAVASALQLKRSPIAASLFIIYGLAGAAYPVILLLMHPDTHTLTWPLKVTYPIVWAVLLASNAALAAAGVIGAINHQNKRSPAR